MTSNPSSNQQPLPSLPSLKSNPIFAPTPYDPLHDASTPTSLPTSTSYSHSHSSSYYPAPPTSFPTSHAHGRTGVTGGGVSPAHSRTSINTTPTGDQGRSHSREGTSKSNKLTTANGSVNANGRAKSQGAVEIGAGPSVRKFGLSVSQSQASAAATEWELAYERDKEEKWAEKVRDDLRGWRGGHGVPRSAYSRQALPEHSYFHQPITGELRHHLPKEIVRVERDWSDGEVCQFESSFPMELEDRISPVQFVSFINTLNEHLKAAYSVRGAVVDNVIAIATWWTSLMWRESTFERELNKVELAIQKANEELFNPVGLNVLTPRDVALQFVLLTTDHSK